MLNDIASLSRAVKEVNPSILVAVDGVCFLGAERFQQEEWGVDAALTCTLEIMYTHALGSCYDDIEAKRVAYLRITALCVIGSQLCAHT